jgi:hypothetical protein
VPQRTYWELKTFQDGPQIVPLAGEGSQPPAKRARVETQGTTPQDMMMEVEYFASILLKTLELK